MSDIGSKDLKQYLSQATKPGFQPISKKQPTSFELAVF